jgi:alkylated DNA repair protein alkB homolog 7
MSSFNVSNTSRRYEQGHWDSVIQNFREIELFDEEINNLKSFLDPIRKFLEFRHSLHDVMNNNESDTSSYFTGSWLPCHAIDLHAEGALNPHVDSVRFSGNLVAGLSLLSSSIMRLKPSINTPDNPNQTDNTTGTTSDTADDVQKQDGFIDLYLPSRSLYVLSGMSRYEFTHELLPSGRLFMDKIPIHRKQRLSVMFRDSKRSSLDH